MNESKGAGVPIKAEPDSQIASADSTVLAEEKPWSVYLIRMRNNSLYCGVTVDVLRRFSQHQSGKQGAKALKGKGPLSLVWSQEVGDKRLAMQLEYRIKRQTKAKKEALIRGEWNVSSLILSK
ncbi:GIY-YIG nuclease family protein [Photobacterium sanguinicancri]|uniref:GIY-YIG nuclease family protein n=1 Tax=Photobacterium sanguinicancri TaxID=875932 RepID=UPI0009F84E7C|nr:GIY-YIG nuclease family protein [Photobacterium sanguinicancri]